MFNSATSTRDLAVTGDRVDSLKFVTAERDSGGTLLLFYDGEAGALNLEVSHGPGAGAPAGWLYLYRGNVRDAEIEPTQSSTDFTEALEYGLDLLCPAI